MRILKIETENYKKLKAFNIELNGDNLQVAGTTDQGKTTAISLLWELITKVADPLSHGEKKGRVKITLGENGLKVFAERKMTQKTNQISILNSEGERISAGDFKKWFSSLGEDPHKILDLKPKAQTAMLLKAVKLPEGIDLESIDKTLKSLEEDRLNSHRSINILKTRLGDEPEKVEPVNVSDLISQRDTIVQKRNEITRITEGVEGFERDVNTKNSEIEHHKNVIAELEKDKVDLEEKISKGKTWLEENPDNDSTQDLDEQIASAEAVNSKIADYSRWESTKKELGEEENAYNKIAKSINDLNDNKNNAVEAAEWPLPGLGIENGEIVYNGSLLSNCGTSKQLLVCGSLAAESIGIIKVVRMDGIEQMSKDDFNVLEKIFNNKGIQVLSSRVSRDGNAEDGEIVIVEGEVKTENNESGDSEA